jgi:hypothetical protein
MGKEASENGPDRTLGLAQGSEFALAEVRGVAPLVSGPKGRIKTARRSVLPSYGRIQAFRERIGHHWSFDLHRSAVHLRLLGEGHSMASLLQSWMYLVAIALMLRGNKWGYFIGTGAAVFWNYANVFVTTFRGNGLAQAQLFYTYGAHDHA